MYVLTTANLAYRKGMRNRADASDFVRYVDILNSDIGEITSRDQIINPYDYLDSSLYRNNARGRALYNEDLARLQEIQKQQEAAYEDYYNSSVQQAEREKEAGINPNLADISAGEASSIDIDDSSPLDGLPTAAQEFNSIASPIVSLVGSAASIASLPTQFAAASASAALSKAQTTGQQLSNLNAYEGLIYGQASSVAADAIASSVSAGQTFDADAFFADPKSFEGLYEAFTPQDTPQYRAAYKRAIGQVQKIKSGAYAQGTSATSGQTAFAEARSNPYFDSDVLLQIASTEPVMDFIEQVNRLNTDYQHKLLSLKSQVVGQVDAASAASAINQEQLSKAAEYKYKTDYFNNFDGDDAALYDMYVKRFDALQKRAVGSMYNNFFSVWKDNKSNNKGLAAAYLIMNGQHMQWAEFLASFKIANATPPEIPSSRTDEIYDPTIPADDWLKKNLDEGWFID